MLSKKIMAAAMAATMVVTASIPSFAGSLDADNQLSGDLDGKLEAPTISMLLPLFSNESLIFDVYNQTGTGKQIISSDLEFVNYSTVPVTVALSSYTVDMTAITTDNPSALADNTWTNTSNKEVYIYLSEATKGKAQDMVKDADGEYVYPTTGSADATHELVASNTEAADPDDGATAKTVASPVAFSEIARQKIMKADFSGGTAIDPWKLGTKNQSVLRFDGQLNPTASWKPGDNIKITPIFQVTPQVVTSVPLIDSDVYAVPALGDASTFTLNITADQNFKNATLTDGDFTLDYEGISATELTTLAVTDSVAGDNEVQLKFTAKATFAATDIKEGRLIVNAPSGTFASATAASEKIVIHVGSYKPEISATLQKVEVVNAIEDYVITVKSDTPFLPTPAATAFTFRRNQTDAVAKTVAISPDGLTATVTLGDVSALNLAAGNILDFTALGIAYNTTANAVKDSNTLQIALFEKQPVEITSVTTSNTALELQTAGTVVITLDQPVKSSLIGKTVTGTAITSTIGAIKVATSATLGTASGGVQMIMTGATANISADGKTITVSGVRTTATLGVAGNFVNVQLVDSLFDAAEIDLTNLESVASDPLS